MTPERIKVDSNALLDIVTEDKTWFTWSAAKLAEFAENSTLCINPVIFS